MSSLSSLACPICSGVGGPFRTPQGEITCKYCSSVLDESNLVSEVTFAETSSGAARVTGQYISADRSALPASGNSRLGPTNQGDSQALTIEKTRRRISSVAAILNIAEHVSSEAVQYFSLALKNNFVKGRKSQHVVSACLYLACRVNKTQHMLMDFAEVICVNVFAIGATYLQLVRAIKLKNVPLTDPTIYVRRFTMALEFGDKERQVRDDAVRVVARMGKDWLIRGRRPAGVAAAAVIIAGRMNNFRRSKLEIVQLAKIAEETIQRRLDEFKYTSASTLTIQEFRHTNIESEADPPSFLKHREMEKKLAQLRETQGDNEEEDPMLNGELVSMAKEINELETKERAEFEKKKKEELKSSEIGKEVENLLADPEFKRASQAEAFLKNYREQKVKEKERRAALEATVLEQTDESDPSDRKWESKISDDPENLDDVDDDEISSMLLTEEEFKLKEQVWFSLNAEYLIEEQKRMLKRQAEIAAGTYKPKKRSRPKPPGPVEDELAATMQEATPEATTKQMISSKKISRKLNYEAVDILFKKNREHQQS